jgi:hypothetical protein
MEQSVYILSKGRTRGDNHQSEKEQNVTIVKGAFLGGYKILLTFSNGLQRVVNFELLFNKYVKGYYRKYYHPENFNKFFVKNGNIYWGEHEEVIFTVSFLLNTRHGKRQKEEVLYVI